MMNRRILIQVTAPTVVIGVVLFGTAMASVWSINRLQRNLAGILTNNVASLVASQELEIRLRQLRFHSFIYLMDPKPERLALVETDHQEFEQALAAATAAANTPKEKELVESIRSGYALYRAELRASSFTSESRIDLVHWADSHPIRHLAEPCQELLQVNKDIMEATALESEAVTRKARTGMILLGVLGPLSGVIVGFGIARGLSRSIARLIVRLEDVRARLDQDVASVNLTLGTAPADLEGQLEIVAARVLEVTEQAQRHQREILRAEQLAAVGQLAASVAHEVRNPLTGIKLLVSAALSAENEPPLNLDDLHVIHDEVGRLEQTVQGLLDYARPPQVCRETGDVRDIINQAVDLMRARANQQRVELRVSTPDHAVMAAVDRRQLGNVVVNLLMNSLDAIPHGGHILVQLDSRAPGHAHLLVRDSGPGLPAEIEKRLFVPFVSSKATGTGLGLSVCQRVVQDHGGTISGRTATEGGAEFEIDLPTAEEECRAAIAGR